IRGRNADGTVEIRQVRIRAGRFRLLDASFNFAYRVQILVDLAAIAWAQLTLQSSDVLAYPIQQTGVLPHIGQTIGGRAPVAKEPLEGDARVSLRRQRCSR